MAKTLKENGKIQGKRLLEKYGPEHFSNMGKKSIAKQLKNDPDMLKRRGKNGAAKRRAKDPRYLEKMRAKRWGKKVKRTALEVLLGK